MSGHTKEPWEIQGCTVYKGNDAGNNNIFFTNVQGGFYQTYDEPTSTDELLANARRIVLAVNACAGLPDSALEQGCVETARTALDAIWRMSFPDRMTAKEMREALLNINTGAKTALALITADKGD